MTKRTSLHWGHLLAVLLLIGQSWSLVHNLTINGDGRTYYFIEDFGFDEGGVMNLKVFNFKVEKEWISEDQASSLAFLIVKLKTNANYQIIKSEENCLSELNSLPSNLYTRLEPNFGPDNVLEQTYTIKSGEEGRYNIFFVNCLKKSVSYKLNLENYNIDSKGRRNFLSSGFAPLPTLFVVLCVCYFIFLLIWIFGFLRGSKSITWTHHLMTVLMFIKLLSILFRAIEYYHLKNFGKPGGWAVVYDIFAILKGFMFFIVIALIGSGWRFIKPFLSDKDKKILIVVIPLQVIDNIALVYLETAAPGSQVWVDMKNIFRLVDIICCGAVLIPIVWSLKHLREAAQRDDKAAINLKKLTLFRSFYFLVVAYIYFTRIIVYLVEATLPFRLAWLGDFFTELATLIFFCVIGYKFRPASDNPYFQVPTEEEEARALEMRDKEEIL